MQALRLTLNGRSKLPLNWQSGLNTDAFAVNSVRSYPAPGGAAAAPPILPSVPLRSRAMFSRWRANSMSVRTAKGSATGGQPLTQSATGVAALATRAANEE